MFGAIKISKNADPDKYPYSGYGIGFYSRSLFSVPSFDWVINVIIFGVDMSSSVHTDNENQDILILGKGSTQGLDNTTLTTEGEYSINFSRSQWTFCVSLHYNGDHSFLFINKAKNSTIKPYPLCLGHISKDFTANNMKTTGLNGHVYNFSVDYDIIDTSIIINIHQYLMKKHDVKECLELLKNIYCIIN